MPTQSLESLGEAIELSGKIKDDELREEILRHLGRAVWWAGHKNEE